MFNSTQVVVVTMRSSLSQLLAVSSSSSSPLPLPSSVHLSPSSTQPPPPPPLTSSSLLRSNVGISSSNTLLITTRLYHTKGSHNRGQNGGDRGGGYRSKNDNNNSPSTHQSHQRHAGRGGGGSRGGGRGGGRGSSASSPSSQSAASPPQSGGNDELDSDLEAFDAGVSKKVRTEFRRSGGGDGDSGGGSTPAGLTMARALALQGDSDAIYMLNKPGADKSLSAGWSTVRDALKREEELDAREQHVDPMEITKTFYATLADAASDELDNNADTPLGSDSHHHLTLQQRRDAVAATQRDFFGQYCAMQGVLSETDENVILQKQQQQSLTDHDGGEGGAEGGEEDVMLLEKMQKFVRLHYDNCAPSYLTINDNLPLVRLVCRQQLSRYAADDEDPNISPEDGGGQNGEDNGDGGWNETCLLGTVPWRDDVVVVRPPTSLTLRGKEMMLLTTSQSTDHHLLPPGDGSTAPPLLEDCVEHFGVDDTNTVAAAVDGSSHDTEDEMDGYIPMLDDDDFSNTVSTTQPPPPQETVTSPSPSKVISTSIDNDDYDDFEVISPPPPRGPPLPPPTSTPATTPTATSPPSGINNKTAFEYTDDELRAASDAMGDDFDIVDTNTTTTANKKASSSSGGRRRRPLQPKQGGAFDGLEAIGSILPIAATTTATTTTTTPTPTTSTSNLEDNNRHNDDGVDVVDVDPEALMDMLEDPTWVATTNDHYTHNPPSSHQLHPQQDVVANNNNIVSTTRGDMVSVREGGYDPMMNVVNSDVNQIATLPQSPQQQQQQQPPIITEPSLNTLRWLQKAVSSQQLNSTSLLGCLMPLFAGLMLGGSGSTTSHSPPPPSRPLAATVPQEQEHTNPDDQNNDINNASGHDSPTPPSNTPTTPYVIADIYPASTWGWNSGHHGLLDDLNSFLHLEGDNSTLPSSHSHNAVLLGIHDAKFIGNHFRGVFELDERRQLEVMLSRSRSGGNSHTNNNNNDNPASSTNQQALNQMSKIAKEGGILRSPRAVHLALGGALLPRPQSPAPLLLPSSPPSNEDGVPPPTTTTTTTTTPPPPAKSATTITAMSTDHPLCGSCNIVLCVPPSTLDASRTQAVDAIGGEAGALMGNHHTNNSGDTSAASAADTEEDYTEALPDDGDSLIDAWLSGIRKHTNKSIKRHGLDSPGNSSGSGSSDNAAPVCDTFVAVLGRSQKVLHQKQLRLLKQSLSLLSEGGRVVYATSSHDPIQNEAVIALALRWVNQNNNNTNHSSDTSSGDAAVADEHHHGNINAFSCIDVRKEYLHPLTAQCTASLHDDVGDSSLSSSVLGSFIDSLGSWQEVGGQEDRSSLLPSSELFPEELLVEISSRCVRLDPLHEAEEGLFIAVIERAISSLPPSLSGDNHQVPSSSSSSSSPANPVVSPTSLSSITTTTPTHQLVKSQSMVVPRLFESASPLATPTVLAFLQNQLHAFTIYQSNNNNTSGPGADSLDITDTTSASPQHHHHDFDDLDSDVAIVEELENKTPTDSSSGRNRGHHQKRGGRGGRGGNKGAARGPRPQFNTLPKSWLMCFGQPPEVDARALSVFGNAPSSRDDIATSNNHPMVLSTSLSGTSTLAEYVSSSLNKGDVDDASGVVNNGHQGAGTTAPVVVMPTPMTELLTLLHLSPNDEGIVPAHLITRLILGPIGAREYETRRSVTRNELEESISLSNVCMFGSVIVNINAIPAPTFSIGHVRMWATWFRDLSGLILLQRSHPPQALTNDDDDDDDDEVVDLSGLVGSVVLQAQSPTVDHILTPSSLSSSSSSIDTTTTTAFDEKLRSLTLHDGIEEEVQQCYVVCHYHVLPNNNNVDGGYNGGVEDGVSLKGFHEALTTLSDLLSSNSSSDVDIEIPRSMLLAICNPPLELSFDFNFPVPQHPSEGLALLKEGEVADKRSLRAKLFPSEKGRKTSDGRSRDEESDDGERSGVYTDSSNGGGSDADRAFEESSLDNNVHSNSSPSYHHQHQHLSDNNNTFSLTASASMFTPQQLALSPLPPSTKKFLIKKFSRRQQRRNEDWERCLSLQYLRNTIQPVTQLFALRDALSYCSMQLDHAALAIQEAKDDEERAVEMLFPGEGIDADDDVDNHEVSQSTTNNNRISSDSGGGEVVLHLLPETCFPYTPRGLLSPYGLYTPPSSSIDGEGEGEVEMPLSSINLPDAEEYQVRATRNVERADGGIEARIVERLHRERAKLNRKYGIVLDDEEHHHRHLQKSEGDDHGEGGEEGGGGGGDPHTRKDIFAVTHIGVNENVPIPAAPVDHSQDWLHSALSRRRENERREQEKNTFAKAKNHSGHHRGGRGRGRGRGGGRGRGQPRQHY